MFARRSRALGVAEETDADPVGSALDAGDRGAVERAMLALAPDSRGTHLLRIFRRDRVLARSLVRSGAVRVNARDGRFGRTLLDVAALSPDASPEYVRFLIGECGAKSAAKPLLRVAVMSGNARRVREILHKTSDVDANCPLEVASSVDRLDLVHMLLHRGAKVTHLALVGAVDGAGTSTRVLKLLLGLLPHAPPLEASAALSEAMCAAAETENAAALALILEHPLADVNAVATESDYIVPIIAAVECGATELVETLLAHGSRLESTADEQPRWSALLTAAAVGADTLVMRFLERGADVRTTASRGFRSNVLSAADNLERETLEALLDAGADIHSPGPPCASTPLTAAVRNSNAWLVRELLRRGADPNAASTIGTSPLALAAEDAFTDGLVALLEAGADHSVVTRGDRPLGVFMLALYHQTLNSEINEDEYLPALEAFVAAGADLALLPTASIAPLGFALFMLRPRFVKALLDAGAPAHVAGGDITALSLLAQTPVEDAVRDRFVEVADMLIAAEVQPIDAAEGDSGFTPLVWAVWRQNDALVERLLAAGADPNRDVRFDNDVVRTVLSVAACSSGPVRTAQLLLEAGADPDRRPPGGLTALFLAVMEGKREAVRLLVAAGAALRLPNELAGREGSRALMECPAGHALDELSDTGRFQTHYCDLCGVRISLTQTMRRCPRCDFDVCGNCCATPESAASSELSALRFAESRGDVDVQSDLRFAAENPVGVRLREKGLHRLLWTFAEKGVHSLSACTRTNMQRKLGLQGKDLEDAVKAFPVR